MPRKALIQLRRDTSANWNSVNPVLASGEIGYETDLNRFKVGDGTLAWSALNYSSAGGISVGATPPDAPSNGSPWFNTDDGTLYVYYDDGNSSQWVQVQANSALEASILERLGGLESQAIAYGRPSYNYVINGGFDIWQRGINITSSSTSPYGADRWEAFREGYAANLSSQKWDGPLTDGIQYCLRLVRAAGDTNTTIIYCGTALETANSIPLRGKTVTLSFYARKGSGMSASGSALRAILLTGTGTDQNVRNNLTGAVEYVNTVTLTTSWQRFTITAALGSNLSQVAARFSWNPTGTAPANDYVEIAGVQLEEGSVATAFRRNSPNIQAELAACQRYYQRITAESVYGAFGIGYSVNSTTFHMTIQLKVPMRTIPSSTLEWTGNAANYLLNMAGNYAVTGLLVDPAVNNQYFFGLYGSATSLPTGYGARLLANNLTTAYIGISAEL